MNKQEDKENVVGNDILLKEYELCEQQNISIGNEVWSATTIFLTVSVTLLGALIFGAMTSDILSTLFPTDNQTATVNTSPLNTLPQLLLLVRIVVVGIGMLVIYWQWIRWLQRMRLLARLNYETMHEIESSLGIYKNWMAYAFDLKNRPRDYYNDTYDALPEALRQKVEASEKNVKYASPGGFYGLIYIGRTLFIIWLLFILIILFLIWFALF